MKKEIKYEEDILEVDLEEKNEKGKAYTIFVVEDSDIYRLVLEQHLKKMTNADLRNKPDCEILAFASAAECLNMMDKKTPDIVVMDYFLNHNRGMDGLQLLKEIKRRSPKTEVLVLSEQQDVLVTAELFNQGAAGYIPKEPQGQNRVQNAVLKTIQRIERKKIEKRRRLLTFIIILILGITIGALYVSKFLLER